MLSLRIALRYLLSRKSHGAVNIISAISLAAIAVAAAAMVIVLSVFNGFSDLASSKLSHIDPDITLTPAEGKYIGDVDSLVRRVGAIEGVRLAVPQIMEQAFAVSADGQMPVTLRGMTPEGLRASGIPGIIIDGTGGFDSDSAALMSVGAAMRLTVRPTPPIDRFTIYEPRRSGPVNPALPQTAFTSAEFTATGVFQVEQEEYDSDFIIITYSAAARLLNVIDGATAVDIYLDDPDYVRKVCVDLKAVSDVNKPILQVRDRYAQQEHAFRMIAVEKWITWVMLAFILIIASFSIISTLSMLILEKQGNMAILSAMGATDSMIDRIFIMQGWLFILVGGGIGLLSGVLLTLGQQTFGWIKLAASDPSLMAIDVYPVRLEATDVAVCFLTLIAIALLITPLLRLLRRR